MKEVKFEELPDKVQEWFKFKNFVTPNVLGYYKLKNNLYAELATERENKALRMFKSMSLFGCSITNKDGEYQEKLSKVFYDSKEALNYLKELSNEQCN